MASSALLVMDLQPAVLELFSVDDDVLASAGSAIDAAHDAGVPVVFVRIAFRPGYPEITPANQGLARLAANGSGFEEPSPASQIAPMFAPREGDVVVTKRRVGAFSGSDLDIVLRARGVDTLVLCGVATGGVVLSTVRYAADLDYRIIVLGDACADGDPEVHRVLVEKVFPRQAEVLTAAEWGARLSTS